MNTPTGRRLKSLDELARDIPPPRDLWAAIEADIDAEPRAQERSPRTHGIGPLTRGLAPLARFMPLQAWGLAAGVALLAIGIWIGRASLPGPGASIADPGTSITAQAPAAGSPDVSAIRAAYAPNARFTRERELLRRDLADRLAALPAETRLTVRASLDTIERARSDIEAALGRDPGNALLHEMLVNAYQDEMRVLATVQEAGAREEI